MIGGSGPELILPLVAIKSAASPVAGELTAPIVYKDEARRIVYGPVLIPNEADSDNDVVTAEKIETVAHTFLKDYGTIDVDHSLNFAGRPVESYLAPQDLGFETPEGTVFVPKGSWMLGVYVEDNSTWDKVMTGELRGYSIMAVSRAQAKKDAQPKRVTLRDLGEGWVAVAVSLVDNPAVPKAKWIAVKTAPASASPDEPELSTIQKTVAALLGIPVAASQESRKFSAKAVGLLRTAYAALGELIQESESERSDKETTKGADEVTPEELKQAIKEALQEQLKPIDERLKVVEKAQGSKPAEEPEGKKGAQETELPPAIKDLLTKVDERLALVEKAITPGSRQPSGQDDTTPVTKSHDTPTRDAFGRRIRQ